MSAVDLKLLLEHILHKTGEFTYVARNLFPLILLNVGGHAIIPPPSENRVSSIMEQRMNLRTVCKFEFASSGPVGKN